MNYECAMHINTHKKTYTHKNTKKKNIQPTHSNADTQMHAYTQNKHNNN